MSDDHFSSTLNERNRMYRASPYKQSPLLYRKSYKPGRRNTLMFRPVPVDVSRLNTPREVKLPPIKGVKG